MAILLSTETNRLLNIKSQDLALISKETGLNYDWLIKFKSNKIKDPSVNKVQKLYEHLTGKPLITEQSSVAS